MSGLATVVSGLVTQTWARPDQATAGDHKTVWPLRLQPDQAMVVSGSQQKHWCQASFSMVTGEFYHSDLIPYFWYCSSTLETGKRVFLSSIFTFLADQGEARACSTNTVVIID